MLLLPTAIHERLAEEFKFAASKIAESDDIDGKLYYFGIFYGETGRQLNMHWDPDLALLFGVTQAACQQITARPRLPESAGFLASGIPDGYLEAIDEVSNELAGAFQASEIDMPRFYAALARTAELTYVTTGNGAYLHQKGSIRI